MNKEERLNELEKSNIILNNLNDCIQINYIKNKYNILKRDDNSFFWIGNGVYYGDIEPITFSPSQAVNIVGLIQNSYKNSTIILTNGIFVINNNGDYYFGSNYDDEIRYYLTNKQAIELKNWLKEILLIGGYNVMGENDYKEKQLERLKYSEIALNKCWDSGICINKSINLYGYLKNNQKDYFYLGDDKGEILFSPKQALEIVNNIENNIYKSVDILNGKFNNGSDGSCFIGYDLFVLSSEETLQLKDWLKKILTIGGYIEEYELKEEEFTKIEFIKEGNTIVATDGINVGKATCNTSIDEFDENKGKLIATARMLGFTKNTVNKIICDLFDERDELEGRIHDAIKLLKPLTKRNWKNSNYNNDKGGLL